MNRPRGRPKKPHDQLLGARYNLLLLFHVSEAVEAFAAREGISAQEWIRRAVHAQLEREDTYKHGP